MTTVIIRHLGLQDYATCWKAMQSFTQERNDTTTDEIWVLEHPPVFTQGQNGKPEHILDPGHIPVIQVDRGGQVTYHGPGQLILYPLIDLKRKKMNIREIVTALEHSVIQFLTAHNVSANAKREAPGVYVADKKICSVGLRIRKGCSYHGLALNVAMDLAPFLRINPCGYKALSMTQVVDWIPNMTIESAKQQLLTYLIANLGYTTPLLKSDWPYANK